MERSRHKKESRPVFTMKTPEQDITFGGPNFTEDTRQRGPWIQGTSLKMGKLNKGHLELQEHIKWWQLSTPETEFMNVQFRWSSCSGHTLESSQTSGFRSQCFHYQPVSNHLLGRGGGVKSVSRRKLMRLLSQLRPRIRPLDSLKNGFSRRRN
jgi:hypothetical protein